MKINLEAYLEGLYTLVPEGLTRSVLESHALRVLGSYGNNVIVEDGLVVAVDREGHKMYACVPERFFPGYEQQS